MKKLLFSALFALSLFRANAQVTVLAGDYKIINIGNDTYGDYTHALILLHQIYNGTLIEHNYSIGTITAMRGTSGSYNRINVVNITTSSAYNGTSGTINSNDDNSSWALKTCLYNGNMYLAVDIPYADAFHGWGYYFSGWTSSTGENMKCVPYMVNGQPVNQTVLSNIQNFSSNMVETHVAAGFNITGNVGIGTSNTNGYQLAVNGNVHAKQVNVDLNNWSDYVFKPEYPLKSLSEVKAYIHQNHHLPDVPSEQEMIKNGLDVGEMNKLLMKKVEELTLYLIEKDEEVNALKTADVHLDQNAIKQERRIKRLEAKLKSLLNN